MSDLTIRTEGYRIEITDNTTGADGYRINGEVKCYDDNGSTLCILSFNHPNPVGAGRTIAHMLDNVAYRSDRERFS